MTQDFKPVDNLVSNIVGTTNLISKILFNKAYVVAAAAVSFIVFVLVLAL